jgi:phosphate transport system permease protein
MPAADRPLSPRDLRRARVRAEPLVWLCSGAVVLAIALLLALLLLLVVRGFGHFWPSPVVQLQLAEPETSMRLGVILDREEGPDGDSTLLLHAGGRGLLAAPLAWVEEASIVTRSRPRRALVVERADRGVVYGFLASIREAGQWRDVSMAEAGEQVAMLEGLIAAVEGAKASGDSEPSRGQPLAAVRLRIATGQLVTLPAEQLLSVHAPNAMNTWQRVSRFTRGVLEFLREAPRRGNAQGGVFPAILGTVTLVLLMTVMVTPLGVLAAVYLQEYARYGPVTQLVRIAVNNLAGVPSIVFGVFGLGFFVYTLGGSLDQLFFSDRLPAPTIGTPGMLWSALTMALLTLPVVVVTTEEGLARVPITLREGSYALGATRAETLWRVVLPAASPALLTGLILAVARATGEVAPLLLVGVAKYSPGLPVDGEFPYLHLDRQFMHLGFYIYDLGFQSPELVTAEGLVFAAALLLVMIVLLLNLAAVMLRSRLREAFRPEETF